MMTPNPDSSMMLDDVEMTPVSPTPPKSAKKAKKEEKKRKRKSSESANNNVDEVENVEDDKATESEPEPKSGKKAKLNLPKMSKEVRDRLKVEDSFIGDVLSMMYVPKHKKTRFGGAEDGDDDSDDEGVALGNNISDEKRKALFPKSTTRVTHAGELQERLQQKLAMFKGNRKDQKKQKGPKLTKVEKRKLSRENKKMKNKLTKAGNAVKAEVKREAKAKGGESWAGAQHSTGSNPAIYNSEGKLVFSKFDFTEENGVATKGDAAGKKASNDPKAALTKIKKQKEKLKSLKASGKGDAVKMITEKKAWENALDKTSGVKVKDDEGLLKKSIKKQEQRKKSSKKKWDARKDSVEKRKDSKQSKRTENIQKRKESVKKGKLKKAAKKGRLVPGFG